MRLYNAERQKPDGLSVRQVQAVIKENFEVCPSIASISRYVKQGLTASAVQQKRVDDLAAKKHKSEAHKAAVRLYNAERQKPDGLSVRQVQAVIKVNFEVCLSNQCIPIENGSYWTYFCNRVQVFMPGLFQHCPD